MGIFGNFFGGEKHEPQPDSYGFQAVPKSGSEDLGSESYDNVNIRKQLETLRKKLVELGEKDDTWSNEDRAETIRKIEELEKQLKENNEEVVSEQQEETV